jgi:hypothetical protein
VIVLTPFAVSSGWLTSIVTGEWAQLLVASAWVGIPSLIALFAFVLPRDVTAEIVLRWRESAFLSK